MSSIPTNLKWTGLIQREKKWKHQFFTSLWADNSVVRGRIWPNFKLIQALMYVIITCMYEKDPIKNNREKVATPFFSNYITICCYGNQWSDLAEFRSHPSFMHVLIACKYEKYPIKILRRKCDDVIFSIISLRDFFQTLKGSQLRSPWSFLAEFRTHSSSYVYHRYLQV